MGHTFAISGLVGKRFEMARMIDHHQREIKRLRQCLYQIDHAYRIRSIKPNGYRCYSRIFKKGECYRLCLETLRDADEVLSTTLITEIIMHKKGLAHDQQATITDSVNNSLHFAGRRCVVQCIGMDGLSIRWKIAD